MDWKTLKIMSYGFKLVQDARIFFINWQNQEIPCVSYIPYVQYCNQNSPPPRHIYRAHTLIFSSLGSVAILFFFHSLLFHYLQQCSLFRCSWHIWHFYFFFFSTTLGLKQLKQLKSVSKYVFLKLCTLLHKTWNCQKAERWFYGQYINLETLRKYIAF